MFHLFSHSDYSDWQQPDIFANTELCAASFLVLDETFHTPDNMKKKKQQRARKLTKKQHKNVKYEASVKDTETVFNVCQFFMINTSNGSDP